MVNDFPPIHLSALLASTIAVMSVAMNAPANRSHGILRRFLPVYPFIAFASPIVWVLYLRIRGSPGDAYWHLVVHGAILLGFIVVGTIVFREHRKMKSRERILWFAPGVALGSQLDA